ELAVQRPLASHRGTGRALRRVPGGEDEVPAGTRLSPAWPARCGGSQCPKAVQSPPTRLRIIDVVAIIAHWVGMLDRRLRRRSQGAALSARGAQSRSAVLVHIWLAGGRGRYRQGGLAPFSHTHPRPADHNRPACGLHNEVINWVVSELA